MSLDDLEIRKHIAPLRAELDRQKEKCAAMKKERDEARAQLHEATEVAASNREAWAECEADRRKLIEQRDLALANVAALERERGEVNAALRAELEATATARAAVGELVGVLKDCMDSFYENGRAGEPSIQLQRRVHDTINEYEVKP